MNNSCVLIPHFNNPAGLIKCIKSIGNFENVDVLIVDDGSSTLFDEEKIKDFFKAQGKVYFIYLQTNQGIEKALNVGANWIIERCYIYLARLDCDDICHPSRFKIQEEFMRQNLEYGLIGTWCNAIDANENILFEMKLPTDYEKIKKRMYFACMFIHPTLFITVEAFKKVGGYSYNFKAAEDYDLCFKIMRKYRVGNLPQKLLNFEYNDKKGISSQNRSVQVHSRIRIIIKYFYLGVYPFAGLLRTSIIYFIPRQFLSFFKTKIGRGV